MNTPKPHSLCRLLAGGIATTCAFVALAATTPALQQSGKGNAASNASPAPAQASPDPARRRAIGAPEISPALAVGGLALLAGGALILTGRRRRALA